MSIADKKNILENGCFEKMDLERTEEELRMEKIRQLAARCSWEQFSHTLRKNMMEKRPIMSPEDKDDLLQASSFLRNYMPLDSDSEITVHLRNLAETLGCDYHTQANYHRLKNLDFTLEVLIDGDLLSTCSVSWFGEQMTEATALRDYMARSRWDLVHNSLAVMSRLVPLELSRDNRAFCLHALQNAENDLMSVRDERASLVEQVNSGTLGFCRPRTESTPFILYPFVEPTQFMDINSGTVKVHDDSQALCDIETYLQLSLAPSQTQNFFSDASLYVHAQWRNAISGQRLPAAYCFKFSRPIIFTAASLKALSALAVSPLNIEKYCNIYQYLINESEECRRLYVRFPGCLTQCYFLDESMLQSTNDGVLREITFAHPRDVISIVHIIRAQLAHNALFESIVRAHRRSALADECVIIRLASAIVDSFDLQFYLRRNLFAARVTILASNLSVSLECIAANASLQQESEIATTALIKSWSLAVMMRSILRRGGAISLPSVKHEPTDMLLSVVHDESDKDGKISHAWFFVPNKSDKSNFVEEKVKKEYKVDERPNLELTQGLGQPPSLLVLLRELVKHEELIPPVKPTSASQHQVAPPRNELMLAPRTSRIHSENTMTINALSDLDAICDMAANIDDGESNISEHSSKSSIVERCSPSTSEVQRLRPQMASQASSPVGERYRASQPTSMSQLSPLEIARQRLAQQTPMNNSVDVFEFDDPPRMAPSSAVPNSSQFHFPGSGQSPYSFAMQGTRGSLNVQPTVKRRGRGRKAGNIGDRMSDPLRAVIDPATGMLTNPMGMPARKPRGTSTARRPRRPRKATHLPASTSQTHQLAGNRPVVQRSFSEMPSYTSQLQPVILSQENRPETISEVDDDSSDEETDPPPPSRNLTQGTGAITPSSSLPPTQSSSCSSLSNLSPNGKSVHTAPSNVPSTSGIDSGSTSLSAAVSGQTSSVSHAVHKNRRGSLEAVVGKLHCKTTPANNIAPTTNPYHASDLYDDESEPSVKAAEVPSARRDSPSVSNSPGARSSPSLSKMTPELQGGSGSDLKIMIKLKQQARSLNQPQASSGAPPSVRLFGQPPSSSKNKEDRATSRQKQTKEKCRNVQDERNRKAAKRERKYIDVGSNKKPRLDRCSEQKTVSCASPKVEFPQALAFASLKNFKIPKVMENEKCDSPAPTVTTTSTTSTPAGIKVQSSPIVKEPGFGQPASATSSAASTPPSSIFPPKPPKSILKTPADPSQMFRVLGGMPPMMNTGRRPLLPDPRTVMHHPPSAQFRPMVGPPPRMMPPGFMQPPSTSGRWMALAPQRQPSPRALQSEPGESTVSKMQDSPSEGLKIVADEE